CDFSVLLSCCLFFFQAEDGIRDFHVTGVQTCALPICQAKARSANSPRHVAEQTRRHGNTYIRAMGEKSRGVRTGAIRDFILFRRSEERRVGKECRSRWWPYR